MSRVAGPGPIATDFARYTPIACTFYRTKKLDYVDTETGRLCGELTVIGDTKTY